MLRWVSIVFRRWPSRPSLGIGVLKKNPRTAIFLPDSEQNFAWDESDSEYFRAVVWKKDNPSYSKPVGYVSGHSAKISAKFIVPKKCRKFVRARSVDNKFRLPEILVKEDGLYPIQQFDLPFEKHIVQYLPDFVIKWEYREESSDKNDPSSWLPAGESSNIIYVLHKEQPKKNSIPASLYFHSLIHISCMLAHNSGKSAGMADTDEVVDEIYNGFVTKCLKKVGSNKCMTYRGGANPLDDIVDPFCRSIFGLLKYEDAACGEWAHFFNSMLKIHGVANTNIVTIVYKDLHDNYLGLLPVATSNQLNNEIDDFFGAMDKQNITLRKILTQGGERVYSFLFVNHFNFNSTDKFYGEWIGLSPITTAVTNKTINGADIVGISGQGGVANPVSVFTNHALVRYTGASGNIVYYDPSYGTAPLLSELSWENAALSGLGTQFIYNIGGVLVPILWLNEMNNTNIQQTSFHID